MASVVTRDTSAGSTRIHCPVCGGEDVAGDIIESEETLTGYGVIPLSRHTNWWVICSECNTRLYSRLTAKELEGKSADEVVGLVYQRVSLVHKFLAITAVLLAIAPGLGIIMGLIALAVNWKSPGWPNTVSKWGLRLSLLAHIYFFGGF